jgi:hypothetical protein
MQNNNFVSLNLRSFWILRSAEWYFRTDVSRQPVGGRLQDGTNKLSRNIGAELHLNAA